MDASITNMDLKTQFAVNVTEKATAHTLPITSVPDDKQLQFAACLGEVSIFVQIPVMTNCRRRRPSRARAATCIDRPQQ